jgi:hypothetical protein
MNKKYSVIALCICFIFVAVAIQAPMAQATTNNTALNGIESNLIDLKVVTLQIGDYNQPVYFGVVAYRLDLKTPVTITILNTTLYDSAGDVLSDKKSVSQIGSGIWIGSFPAIGASGTYTIEVSARYTTSYGLNITKKSYGTLTLSGWLGMENQINSTFSSWKNTIDSMSINNMNLTALIQNFGNSLNGYINSMVSGIQELLQNNIADPSFHFMYVNIPPYDDDSAMDAFRASLNQLSYKGISWQMSNITSLADLEDLILNNDTLAPVLVFSGDVVPMPDGYNTTWWTLNLAGYSSKNSGTIAFFSNNWTARYFGNSTMEVEDDNAFSRLLNASILVGGNQIDRTAIDTYWNTEVTDFIENWFVTTLPRWVNTGYKTIDDYYFSQFNHLAIDYKKVYQYEDDAVVYALSNQVNKIFVSPFSNNTLNGVLLYGEIVYSFYSAYSAIMHSLAKTQGDNKLTVDEQSWAYNEMSVLSSDWNAKDFSALTNDFNDVLQFSMNITSEPVAQLPLTVDMGYDYLNTTQSNAVSLESNMYQANQTVCIAPTSSESMNWLESALSREQNYGIETQAGHTRGDGQSDIPNGVFFNPQMVGVAPNNYPAGWTGASNNFASVTTSISMATLEMKITSKITGYKYIYYDLGTNPDPYLGFNVKLSSVIVSGMSNVPDTGFYIFVTLYDLDSGSYIRYLFGQYIYGSTLDTYSIYKQVNVGDFSFVNTNWESDYQSKRGIAPNLNHHWRIEAGILSQSVSAGWSSLTASAQFSDIWMSGNPSDLVWASPSDFSLQGLGIQLSDLWGIIKLDTQNNGNLTFHGILGLLKNISSNAGLRQDSVFDVATSTWVHISDIIGTKIVNAINQARSSLLTGIFTAVSVAIALAIGGIFSIGSIGIAIALGAISTMVVDWFANAFSTLTDILFRGLVGTLVNLVYSIGNILSGIISAVIQQLQMLMNNIGQLLIKITNTIQDLIGKIAGVLTSVKDYVVNGFDVVKNWTLGGILFVKNAINNMITMAQQTWNSLTLSSGFLPFVQNFIDLVQKSITDNKVIMYILNQLGITIPTVDLFEKSTSIGKVLAQGYANINGYTILAFGSGASLDMNNVTIWANYNGTVINGDANYSLYDLSNSLISSGTITFVNGVAVLDTSDPLISIASFDIVYNGTHLIDYVAKTSAELQKTAVYGTYTLLIPATAIGGELWNVVLAMNNMRYSNGTAIVYVNVYDPTGQLAGSRTDKIWFAGSGLMGDTMNFTINPYVYWSGQYTITISVIDEATGCQWIGVESTVIQVQTYLTLQSILLLIAIIAIAGITIYGVWISRKNFKLLTDFIQGKVQIGNSEDGD